MPKLLLRLLECFRPHEGWIPFGLILVALLCAPAALLETNNELGTGALLLLTLLALVIGLRLARSRISGRAVAILGLLLGIGLTIVVVGCLLPPLSLLWIEIGRAVQWLGNRGHRESGLPLPFASAASFSWRQLNDLGVRLWWWSHSAYSGGPAQDPVVFLLLGTFLSWAFSLFATWHIYRRRAPLVGLLPSGLVVAVVAFFTAGMPVFYLLTYLFCTLWLLALAHLWKGQERWDRTETDYPDNMGFDLAMGLGPWLVGLVILAAVFPVIHLRQVSRSFWRVMEGPWSRVEQLSEQLFGPLDSAYYGGGGASGSLPRSHLLGGGPELGETVVFYVTTNDPPPSEPDHVESETPEPQGPRRYWRGSTYDTYTGQGWVNGPLEQRSLSPDQLLDPGLPAGFELLQQFDVVTPLESELHLANAPLRIDHNVEAWWRAAGDLAYVTSEAQRYTVLSRPPEPAIPNLRAAPDIQPPAVREHYLALPEGLPQRVLRLAEQVTSNAKTRYDKAQAIEAFLRTYTYTLDLPAPPTNRDLVDYFLFDVQEGYCDYYASAMVVMARAVGIPARLASGYAQGTYDHVDEKWVVVEKDGHSWPEIYFDGIGWLEFEPTAGQPALVRPGATTTDVTVPPKPARVPSRQAVLRGLLALSGILLLLVAILVVTWLPKKGLGASASDTIRDRHSRLIRWGARLGYPLRDGQTPYEYGAALIRTLHRRGEASRWPQVQRASDAAPSEVQQLVQTFVRVQYSRESIPDHEGWHIRQLWTRLRRRFWWLWLLRY